MTKASKEYWLDLFTVKTVCSFVIRATSRNGLSYLIKIIFDGHYFTNVPVIGLRGRCLVVELTLFCVVVYD